MVIRDEEITHGNLEKTQTTKKKRVKVYTRTLEEYVYYYTKVHKYWWAIPRFHYAHWEADFICFGPGKGILEVEIKTSWSDYRADAKKVTYEECFGIGSKDAQYFKKMERDISKLNTRSAQWKPPKTPMAPISKHDWLLRDYPCAWRPNYFVYAAPVKLAQKIAKDEKRKVPFGVWGFTDDGYGIPYITPRKLMKFRPWWMGEFKFSSWKRAMWFMDTYFTPS